MEKKTDMLAANGRRKGKPRRPLDAASKMFFGRYDVAGDLFTYGLFRGKYVVRPEYLTLLDPSHYRTIQKEDSVLSSDNSFNDLMFKLHIPEIDKDIGLALELQSREAPDMASRVMSYEARFAEEGRQKFSSGTGTVMPVISSVLNLDTSPWSGSPYLYGDISSLPDFIQKLVNNYKFSIMNITDLAKKADIMTCSNLRAVLNCVRYRNNTAMLRAALKNGMPNGIYPWDAAVLLNLCLGMKMIIQDDEEEIDMCRGIEKWVESATRKAMKEGKKEGIKEGKKELLQSIIIKMLSQARPVADIIAITGANRTMIRSVAEQNNLALL
ncbi:MAG: Rpn family recombination-promoting nuclease/putative transposase [Victivallales bacterium]|nr:Rpn family recombination-promoting nuclease/putative transposase [Victivallales bacterium]